MWAQSRRLRGNNKRTYKTRQQKGTEQKKLPHVRAQGMPYTCKRGALTDTHFPSKATNQHLHNKALISKREIQLRGKGDHSRPNSPGRTFGTTQQRSTVLMRPTRSKNDTRTVKHYP